MEDSTGVKLELEIVQKFTLGLGLEIVRALISSSSSCATLPVASLS